MLVQTRETMLKVHINEMPNECLTAIFNYFPLQQRIPLRIICPRWYGVIGAMCNVQKSLKLFKGLGDSKVYCKKIFRAKLDCLRLKPGEDLDIKPRHYGGNSSLLQFLTNTFPNIEHLVFSCATQLESPQLAYLLQKWPNLISLTVHGDIDLEQGVLDAFKQITSLRRLYLLTRTAQKPLPDNVMSQLEHLTLAVNQYNSDFNEAMALLKPSCTLSLDTNYTLFEQISRISNKSEHKFTLNVTHLQIARVYDQQQVRLISQSLRNLEYLEFSGGQVTYFTSVLIQSYLTIGPTLQCFQQSIVA